MIHTAHKLRTTVFLLLLGFSTTAQNDQMSLKHIVATINNSLSEVDGKIENIQVSHAVITLTAVQTSKAGGGIKYFVSASKAKNTDFTTELEFEYCRVKSRDTVLATQTHAYQPNKKLTDAIIAAASEWKDASSTIKGLAKNSFSVTFAFSVTSETELGIELELFGIGFDGKVGDETKTIHTMTLTFENSKGLFR